jgi:hypothetical protein
MSVKDPERLSARSDVPELRELARVAQDRLPDASALARMRTRLEVAVNNPNATALARASGLTPLTKKLLLLALGSSVVIAGLGIRAALPRTARAPAPISSALPVLKPPTAPEPLPPALPEPAASALQRPIVPNVLVPVSPPRAPASTHSQSEGARSELDLIGSAGRALKNDPALALALANEHQRLYPGGLLTEERELIAIEALAKVGKRELARARAERFSVSFPRSAHLARVARAIGEPFPETQKNPTPPALGQ